MTRMWISVCGLTTALILAVIGVAIDNLMIETGSGTFGEVSATLDYGWQEVSWTITTTNYYIETNRTYITYSDAYNEYCANQVSPGTYCDDLENIKNAGQLYLAFNIIGILLLTTSLIIACIGAIGKSACQCKCRIGWAVSIICALAAISLLIAFSIFLSDFSSNVDSLYSHIFPVLITWNQPTIGVSIACLITAFVVALLSICCGVWEGRNGPQQSSYSALSDQAYVPYAPQQAVYVAYAQPLPYSQAVNYGQTVPYGQTVAYGQTVPYGQTAPYGQTVAYGEPTPYSVPPPAYAVPIGSTTQ